MFHLVDRVTGEILGVCAGRNYLQHENESVIVIQGDADKNTHCYDPNNLTPSGIVEIEPKQINQEVNSQAFIKHFKDRRLQKLRQSDWTQFADSPLTDTKKAEWATYRQALRDLPQEYPNAISNDDIIWPTKPR